MVGAMSRERKIKEFVLQCLRPRPVEWGAPERQSADIAIPDFWRSQSAWDQAFDEARQQQSLLTLALVVQSCEWLERLSRTTQFQISQIVKDQTRLHELFQKEIDHLINHFGATGVPMIIFDGMDFRHRFYHRPEMRSLTGIDLLVPKNHLADVMRELGREGFRIQADYSDGSYYMELGRPPDPVTVRIHWQLLEGPWDWQQAALWTRSQEWDTLRSPSNIRCLVDEDLLIYLVRTVGTDREKVTARWLNDFHYLLTESKDIRWQNVIDQLTEHRAIHQLWYSLFLITSEWGTAIPQSVYHQVTDLTSPWRRRALSLLSQFSGVLNQSRMGLSSGIGQGAFRLAIR